MNAAFLIPDRQKQKVSGHISSETFYFIGADERNRTVDLLITNELLYQLSYIGTKRKIIAERLCSSQKVRSGKSTHLRSVLLR